MIRTEHLYKNYGTFQALTDLNLQIDQGKVFGFIGPNGAGKSTTMLILSTLLTPTSGKAFVGGYDVVRQPKEVRKLVGYMPDFFGVYDHLKATEYLDFYAGAYHIPSVERPKLIADLLELVNLTNKADSYVDTLSRGMKQRLGLARCLIHDPQVLILDEPASGLDPRARIEMREILKQLRQMGKTIIISSHILPELSELCDEIGVIENGKMIAYTPVADFQKGYEKPTKIMQLTVVGEAEKVLKLMLDSAHTKLLDRQNQTFRFQFAGKDQEQAAFLKMMIDEGIPVVSFGEVKENLEDVFLSITEGVGN
jgi:ABC-2 type transport system ATP-binding protein